MVGQNFPFETFLRGPIAGVPTSSVVAQGGQHVVDFVLDAPDGVRGVRDVLVLAIENGGGGGGPSAQWWWGGGHLVTKPLVVGGRNEEWIGHVFYREGANLGGRVAVLGKTHLGERAHLGEKNTGIWDSQIWDPRYLVPLFLVNFSIEAFKFNR